VTRGLWESVGKVLERGVSDTQRKWVVEEALKDTDDGYIENFLPMSRDGQLDSVVTILIARRRWKSVGQVLKRLAASVEAGEQQCKDKTSKIIQNIIYYCPHTDYLTYILPFLADAHVDSQLSHSIFHGKWLLVESLLKHKHVSDSKHAWAVSEIRKWNSGFLYSSSIFETSVLPFCTNDQLETELKRLVDSDLWDNVALVLKKKVSDQLSRKALLEVCKYDDGEHFVESMLPLCADDMTDTILVHLVKREEWEAVHEVLKQRKVMFNADGLWNRR
jgi:hypothetical protein